MCNQALGKTNSISVARPPTRASKPEAHEGMPTLLRNVAAPKAESSTKYLADSLRADVGAKGGRRQFRRAMPIDADARLRVAKREHQTVGWQVFETLKRRKLLPRQSL